MRLEFFVAAFEEVDFGVEDLGVVVHMEVPVDLSQGSVHFRASVLAKLAVEDDYSTFSHYILNYSSIFKEVFFDFHWRVQIYGTLDMSSFKFVIKAAIHNYEGMSFIIY